MLEFFKQGGWGMYPTFVFGLATVASAAVFGLRHDRRYLPMTVALGLTMLASGLLSFVSGVIVTFRYLGGLPANEQVAVAALGIQEAAHNLVLALILSVLTGALMSLGLLKTVRA